MPRERLVSPELISKEEEKFNQTLRPPTLSEYIGQPKVVEKLKIALDAARLRGESVEHVLLYGPPGLGKTTLAHIVANAMGAKITVTSGPAVERPADLMGILASLGDRDVLFIDEIHRLPASVEEFLYPAMEDFKVDIVLDKGMYARTINYSLKKFTLVAATTRAGTLSAPLRNRFGHFYHLEFYSPEELVRIVERSAKILGIDGGAGGAAEIARRARGTPRVANRLLKRVRDYAEVKANGRITTEVAEAALKLEGVDECGLDDLDRSFLKTIIQLYHGGPVGVEALAATLNEEIDTLVDMVEPFLLQQGFISRTKTGRCANEPAYRHLNVPQPRQVTQGAPGLFDQTS
ncbi:MAG: Holliday junction branch migration DNA helicase RuvB [Acidobacteriota bacterium]|nr:Holliday junction branch migration DNA helicase RuvB [Acidobacteriota bacterium]